MKYIDLDDLDLLPGVHLKNNDTFSFHCHPGLGCFNLCCRNLNLFLYPYDVIRLKNNLDLSSDQFLDRYVDIVLRESASFPEVLLRMSENDEKTCPFVIASGCSVYPDRPDTCRTFPVEQGVLYDDHSNQSRLIQFFRPPDFCLGQHEPRIWTSRTWALDQDAVLYNRMTARWAEIRRLFHINPLNDEDWSSPKAKMAFMAIYNTDRFRDFVFTSSFLKRYKLNSDKVKKIRMDDVELLKFGFDWVKLFIWGIKSRHIRLR
jgi:Fe-S-cluster containining protein